jgi:hypothetical protein
VNGGFRAGFDGFVFFLPRLAEMGVHVDQTGQYDFPGSVEHFVAIVRRRVEFDDFAIVNAQVSDPVNLLTRIHNATID